ncbi:MAG TPA: SagB/ThcOx family dehydrogenase [Tepidisphaeraceae bacterium]|jgi:SagB-type dehydrogenase family enzyme|nr:SagB/ThcOx family dehydrogenase [Tepidisphaeraceae bacterium]
MHARQLPRDILERVERVLEYHRSTKLTPHSVRANPTVLDAATKPAPHRCFADLAAIPLPTKLLDASAPAIALLSDGVGALAESQLRPPQDLRTLASWLFLADGIAAMAAGGSAAQVRTCPSSGALYPYEIYVAVFGVEGLEPGLYHYNVKDFTLCKLRDGLVTLATIKRGRPDLNFLKSVPAAILVSTIFWRSAWRYRQRGYRMALLDAGHLVQNLVAAANGLGIATNPRLQVNDKNMRELIGIPSRADFGLIECVQAMVVWADIATNPITDAGVIGKRASLPRIRRAPLSSRYIPYGSIVATHDDCAAPGMALRDIRSPSTELSPMPDDRLSPAPATAGAGAADPGATIRHALLSRRSIRSFSDRSMSLHQFLAINRLAFRGGSIFPMMPDGPHLALLRPFWVCSLVAGLDAGIWYYDPIGDRMACLVAGDFHSKSAFLCVEQSLCSHAAAVCFLVADLRALTAHAGPDIYRLTHLEAGLVGQRAYLAATAMGLGCCGIGAFYDDEIRKFLSLDETGWEPIYAFAVGYSESR